MGPPVFEPALVPFDATGLSPQSHGSWQTWPLALAQQGASTTISVAVLSMGNPHAVQLVDDVERAPVTTQGPLVENHARFPRRVNAGFLQVVDRTHVKLRVWERGAGETLACGTGACAAVVAGIRLGLLDARVDVQTRGGVLTIEWSGDTAAPVLMTGPAVTVYEGEINLMDENNT
jgi:diaminopimelate epimerase